MLTVHSDELGEAGKVLERLSVSLKDTQPMMRGLATLLESSSRKRFETKTAPDGKKWADWADSTKIRYAQKVYKKDHKTGKRHLITMKPRPKERLMRDSSRLLRSLTRHATAQMAQVGTNVQYAPYHQLGTKHMVARPIFGISDQDRVDILDLLGEFVRNQWEQAT